MSMNSPIILSIDGNIGSGKSTLYEDLKEYYKDNHDICFVPEPVDEWKNIVDKDNVPILTNLYKDTNKYAFRFQMMAYISRLHLLRQQVKANKYKIIISERCVQTDKNVFAQMLYDDGLIDHDEFQIYLKWFDEFLDDIKLSGVIYVRADPQVCDTRVKIRGREGENIPLAYLTKCHEYHEKWLNADFGCEKICIDANVDTARDEHKDIRISWIETINSWIFNTLYSDGTKDLPNTVIGKTRNIIYTDESTCTMIDSPTLYFDGACRGNPSSRLGLGALIKDSNGNIISSTSIVEECSEPRTNNDAEYLALINGLTLANKLRIKNLNVRGDSALIINHVTGTYQVRAENLKPLHAAVKTLESNFYNINYQHIKREFNKEADKLANNALDSV